MDDSLNIGPDANREHKDSVFTRLLNGDAVAAIEITNTFFGTHYGPDTPVIFTTLRNVLADYKVNDLSFIIDDKLIVLIEHQSTINPNLPYRMGQFTFASYRILHSEKDEYRTRKMTLQRPRFLVFYNGEQEMPDVSTLRLSDLYAPYDPTDPAAADGTVDLELTVKVYNINNGRNAELLKSCTALRDYSIFIGMVREYGKTMPIGEAVQKAVKDCIDQDVLKDFLLKHKGEIINMLTSEFNMDLALKVREEEGAMNKAEEIAKRMLDQGHSIETVVSATGLTVDDVIKLTK